MLVYLSTRRSVEVVRCSHQCVELLWKCQLWVWAVMATPIPRSTFLNWWIILGKLPDKPKYNLPLLHMVAAFWKKSMHIKTLPKYFTFTSKKKKTQLVSWFTKLQIRFSPIQWSSRTFQTYVRTWGQELTVSILHNVSGCQASLAPGFRNILAPSTVVEQTKYERPVFWN